LICIIADSIGESAYINFINYNPKFMTSSELKSLVKEYFNLVEAEETAVETVVEEVAEEFAAEEATEETVSEEITEETFGEIKDVNGAFTIKYPGDSLQIGDKVTVETAEGQEMDAPDGTHELADGTKIVTKDSVVEKIESADGEKVLATEEMAEESAEEEMEEVVVEVEPETSLEDVVKEIADAVAEQMKSMEEKMNLLEDKIKMMEDAPAAEPTITSTGKEIAASKFSKFDATKAKNAKDMKLALSMINKRKK